MIEFYPQVRAVHIAAVVTSGLLFAARGIGVLAGGTWPQAAAVRLSSYTIDTVLLTAALMLVTMLPAAMFGNGWLATKLALLMLYVVAGSMALKRSRSARGRRIWFAAAILLYASMFGIARMHHPLGWGLLILRG
jgi:uncharacterized membrane protein SirB2